MVENMGVNLTLEFNYSQFYGLILIEGSTVDVIASYCEIDLCYFAYGDFISGFVNWNNSLLPTLNVGSTVDLSCFYGASVHKPWENLRIWSCGDGF
jgi:hypothetical protein